MKTAILDKIQNGTNRLPYLDKIVLVEANGVRHLANQDQSGKWKTLSRRKELRGSVEVIRVVR